MGICVGIEKGFNTEFALLSLIGKWKKKFDNTGHTGGILMDLSKAFNIINMSYLLQNYTPTGFQKMLHSCMSDCWPRAKINNSFSSCSTYMKRLPQGLVLVSILFNIYLRYYALSIYEKHKIYLNHTKCLLIVN